MTKIVQIKCTIIILQIYLKYLIIFNKYISNF